MFAITLAVKQYIANRSTADQYFAKYDIDYERGPYLENKLRLNWSAKLDLCVILGDAFLLTTTCVLGILGALSVIGMAPAAAYAFLGISSTIALAWLIMAQKSLGLVCIYSKNLLKASCTQSPSLPTEAGNETKVQKIMFDASTFMAECSETELDLRELLFGKVTYLPSS